MSDLFHVLPEKELSSILACIFQYFKTASPRPLAPNACVRAVIQRLSEVTLTFSSSIQKLKKETRTGAGKKSFCILRISLYFLEDISLFCEPSYRGQCAEDPPRSPFNRECKRIQTEPAVKEGLIRITQELNWISLDWIACEELVTMTDIPMLVNVYSLHKSMWLLPLAYNNISYLNETMALLYLATVLTGFRNTINCINMRYPCVLKHNNNWRHDFVLSPATCVFLNLHLYWSWILYLCVFHALYVICGSVFVIVWNLGFLPV